MAAETGISWADATFNPWIGCTRISPACDGCYAAALMGTEGRHKRADWGEPGKGAGTRSRTGAKNWNDPMRWDRKAERDGTRPFVFCASLADVFDVEVEADWRGDLFDLIRQTPNLVWLLLTKRPQMIGRLWFKAAATGGWPANAAIGTTVEDRKRLVNLTHLQEADRFIRQHSETGPAFLFASFEPLLEDLGDLSAWFRGPGRIDWAITGGETSQGKHRARPQHPAWFRSIRDQAVAAGVAYQHKQNGEWVQTAANEGTWPVDAPGHIRMNCDGSRSAEGWPMQRVGKDHAGRLLDGRTWDERPSPNPLGERP